MAECISPNELSGNGLITTTYGIKEKIKEYEACFVFKPE